LINSMKKYLFIIVLLTLVMGHYSKQAIPTPSPRPAQPHKRRGALCCFDLADYGVGFQPDRVDHCHAALMPWFDPTPTGRAMVFRTIGKDQANLIRLAERLRLFQTQQHPLEDRGSKRRVRFTWCTGRTFARRAERSDLPVECRSARLCALVREFFRKSGIESAWCHMRAYQRKETFAPRPRNGAFDFVLSAHPNDYCCGERVLVKHQPRKEKMHPKSTLCARMSEFLHRSRSACGPAGPILVYRGRL